MKYCDLVMKGGITSGIVYPNAVLALSKNYRFKNIGGTSAGAIAAAASAAAAYGDRRRRPRGPIPATNTNAGFQGLKKVSDQLRSEGFIYRLFQPAFGARIAYHLVVTLAGKASKLRKCVAVIAAVPLIAPIEMAIALATFLGTAALLGGYGGVWGAVLPAVPLVYTIAALAAMIRTARVMRSNLLGLCSGRGTATFFGETKEGLTEWLHEVIQSLAGKPADDPLTFSDLWSAPRYTDEPAGKTSLGLQMITTSVSHHEPRTLPFTAGAFWFLEEEFSKLFSDSVVQWLLDRSGPPQVVAGKKYYRLVGGGDLPVIVATRMSLSFPMLLSAVPLHEAATRERAQPGDSNETSGSTPQDQTTKPEERSLSQSTDSLASGGRSSSSVITSFRVCWFSDGGISSNFPIHLFDAALPVWPTFAIDLVYPETNDTTIPPKQVWLPDSNNKGWQQVYQSVASKGAIGELSSFLFGIVGTMQNWRDLLLSRAPGQRDRIVHVALSRNEGGMNLNMDEKVLERISEKGTLAGEEFGKFDFSNHYWIRWRNLASAYQRYVVSISGSLNSKPPIAEFEDAYSSARAGTSPGSYQFKLRQSAEAQKLLADLDCTGAQWRLKGAPDLTDGAPRPLPQMQISPIF